MVEGRNQYVVLVLRAEQEKPRHYWKNCQTIQKERFEEKVSPIRDPTTIETGKEAHSMISGLLMKNIKMENLFYLTRT